MRLSAFAAVVAGAGIAQVTASPIRIITITQGQTEGAHALDGVRFGHSIPLPPAVATMTWKTEEDEGSKWAPVKAPHMRRPCGGRMSRFRQKGIEISNAFRKALGLPIIENHPHPHHGVITTSNGTWGKYMILPADTRHPPPTPPHHRYHHHHGMRVHRVHGASFATRLHYSLMNLGRWEGRAVAFVLGCGIGVHLRMFWVLAIVTYRAIKGQREDEHEYSHITIIEEYEEIPVQTPPPYPVDEKVAIKEDEVPASTEESK